MVKLFKRTISILLVAICLTGTLLACSKDDDAKEPIKEAATTKEVEQEVTTINPMDYAINYNYKGYTVFVNSKYSNDLKGKIIEKGYEYILNDYVSKEVDDVSRGSYAFDIVRAFYTDVDPSYIEKISEEHLIAGAINIMVSYNENLIIPYVGEEK